VGKRGRSEEEVEGLKNKNKQHLKGIFFRNKKRKRKKPLKTWHRT